MRSARGFNTPLRLLPLLLPAERGQVEPAVAPDATIVTDHGTLLALSHRRRELGEALRSGDVEIEGDEQVLAAFLGLFTIPEPARSAAGT